MKKRRIIRTVGLLLCIISMAISVYCFMPTKSVWNIAEMIKQYDNDVVLWISDKHYHFHVPDTEQRKEFGKLLDDLEITIKLGECELPGDYQYKIVIEEGPKEIQYFFFNESFTKVWCCDSTLVDEYFDTSVIPTVEVYGVKNPWKMRAYFKYICENDPKTQLLDSLLTDSEE